MSRFLVLLCVVLLPTATAINVTNSGNQQEIMNIKKDLTMLRNLVISLNTSLVSTQIDKDEKVKGMNTTIQAQQVEMRSRNAIIQAQQVEMRSMNATIQAQGVEMRSMNSTIYAQQQELNASNQDYQRELRTMDATIQAQQVEMRSMNSTIYVQQQELNASNQDYQRELRTMNATIQAQGVEMRSMNSTIYAQQQELNASNQDYHRKLRKLNATIQVQKQVERAMNTTIDTQQKEIVYLIRTAQDQQHKMTLMKANIKVLEKENQTIHDELKLFRENNSAEIENLKEADKKGNQNYGAFQVVVQDLVTNVNTLRNTSQIQIGSINDNLTSLARQIHYTSLSFLDAQKMLKELESITKETKRNMSSHINNLGQEIHHLQSERNRTYAFTVSTSSGLSNYNNKKIVYDKVITNKGGAYNSNTGIFTCPSPGTYVFTWSTMSRSASQNCYAYISHNGNLLLVSYNEAASNTILLTLTVGDHVWIQTSTCTYCYGYPFTAFSGWKI